MSADWLPSPSISWATHGEIQSVERGEIQSVERAPGKKLSLSIKMVRNSLSIKMASTQVTMVNCKKKYREKKAPPCVDGPHGTTIQQCVIGPVQTHKKEKRKIKKMNFFFVKFFTNYLGQVSLPHIICFEKLKIIDRKTKWHKQFALFLWDKFCNPDNHFINIFIFFLYYKINRQIIYKSFNF